MSDIFISYSKHDTHLADYLKEQCEQVGLTTFVDRYDIEPGTDWRETIKENVINASALWLLASNQAIESRMVNQEIGIARGHDIPIVPIVWKIKPNALPVDIQAIQALVLTDKSPSEVTDNLNALIRKAKSEKRSSQVQLLGFLGIGVLAWLLSSKSD